MLHRQKREQKANHETAFANGGFTLFELIVCIAIMAVITLIVGRYIFSSSVFYKKNNADVNLDIEIQGVVDHLGDEMQECESVDIGDSSRYLLRKSDEKAILLVMNGKQLVERYFEVDTTGLDPSKERDYRDACDNQINEWKKPENDSTLDSVVLTKYLKSFKISEVSGTSSKLYQFSITLENDETTKECNKQIYLRN